MSTVELHAKLGIRPGQLDAFKAHVNDIVEDARRLDTSTLRFDWYISDDGTRCEVHEVYANAAAFFEHGQHIMQARARLFADCVDSNEHHVAAFGDVPQQIVEMASGHGNAIERYIFLQGLEAAPVS